MFMQHWSKLKITGYQPLPRYAHAACCIAGPLTGQQNPLLMMFGGTDGFNVFDVLGLLDVDKGVWYEVCIRSLCRQYAYMQL